jgi:hypothetical protein
MTPFERIPPDARENQLFRETLLAQPPEFFRAYFGYLPDMMQKLFLVEKLIHRLGAPVVYANDIYRVQIRNVPPLVQLDICRHDGEPCTTWRHFQQIKNELIGPECEGVELFPAESRLVDTSNQYHLWVCPNANYRFPFGYGNRLVLEAPVLVGAPGGERIPAMTGRQFSSAGLADIAVGAGTC